MASEDAELKDVEAQNDSKKASENDEFFESKEKQPHASPSSPIVETKTKIDVLLKATGDAPIMKKKRWAVERSKRISWISEFIKKYLKLDPHESMFLYVQQSFAPSPDTEVGTVFDCFGSDGKLVIHYCRTQAWG